MGRKIRFAAEIQIEVYEQYSEKAPEIKNNSAIRRLNELVQDEIEFAEDEQQMNPSNHLMAGTVIQRIAKLMKDDYFHNFTIWDLKGKHYKKVADLFGCDVLEVKKEFFRLLYKPEPEKRYYFEDLPAPINTPPILKSLSSLEKTRQNEISREQKADDDEVYVDLADLLSGLPNMVNDNPHNHYTNEDDIRCFLTNLKLFGIDISELSPQDFRELAEFLELNTSTVKAKLFKMKREFEEELKKEQEIRRLEKTLDALVTEDIEIVRYFMGKVAANTLTMRQFITQLYHKMELESLTELGLKHRHFAAVADLFNCGILEVMDDYIECKKEKENIEPAPPNHAILNPIHTEDQENHHEEPVAKRAKIVMEPKIEEVKIEDPEPEEEYQMDYYEDQTDHVEEVYDPEFQDQNLHPEDGFSWDYVNGIPAPVDQEEPALSEYDELDPQEMELEEEYDEAAELKHPNGSSWEYGDGRQYAVDEDRAYEEAEPEEMDVVQEEQQLARVEQEDELQDIRDMFIGQICPHAEKNINDQTLTEFKKRSSLRWLFNMLADQDFPMELTERQFDKVAKSFNCDRDDIESVFDFYKTEKEFLDELDGGRPEDQRITDLINGIMAGMAPLSENLEYQNKILESFYRKAVENKNELILNSRQKRRLAAHLGLTVTEVMKSLRKWTIRDLPEPAPEKRMTKQSEIVPRPKNLSKPNLKKNQFQSEIPKVDQPEQQVNPSSVEIAREEQFWGSLAELEPTETIADREAAAELVEEEKKKKLEELARTETDLEKQIAKPNQPKYKAAVKIVRKERNKWRANIQEHLTRTETYLDKYRKRIAMPYQPKYTSGLSKVVEQFGRANNHATKWMPPPVLEAYRTAFLTILYEEIDRELNEKEADEIARFLKTKNFDYLRRKEKQFFETERIELDQVE